MLRFWGPDFDDHWALIEMSMKKMLPMGLVDGITVRVG